MVYKALIFVAVLAVLAVSDADPIRRPKKPVGECPPKNGANPTYLPDSDDCAKFYECESGTPIPKQCMTGLCFDPKLNVCAFPDVPVITPLSAVGNCPPRDTNVTIYLPDNANCSIYYVCSNGIAYLNNCPPDMSWNNKDHICDWNIDANCNLDGNVTKTPFNAVGKCPAKDGQFPVYLPDDENDQIYYECSNGVAIQNECAGDLIWNTVLNTCDFPKSNVSAPSVNLKPMSAVGKCPAKDGQFPVYLPDDENDQIYYECSNGVAIQNECAGDLIWNTVLNTCDFPNSAFFAPLSAVGSCPPRDGNVTVFLPDSDNCTIYYICSNGRPFEAHCSPGMAWNPKLNICDWAIDVECTNSRNLARKPVGKCPPVDPANPVYLPDSDSCSIYYECSNGVAVENNCPPDMEFNPKLSVCDNPINAGCTANTSPTESTSSIATEGTTTSDTTTDTTI